MIKGMFRMEGDGGREVKGRLHSDHLPSPLPSPSIESIFGF